MNPIGMAESKFLALPPLVRAAIEAHNAMGAIDLLIKVGHEIPWEVLSTANAELQAKAPPWFDAHIEPYLGRVRLFLRRLPKGQSITELE